MILVADLPLELLENIFKELQGRYLIELTKVCSKFNLAIGESRKLMNKIRLRCKPSTVQAVDEVLSVTKRRYVHIKFEEFFFGQSHFNYSGFFRQRDTWLSFKMMYCRFYSVPKHDFEPLFKDLVELEMGLGSGGLPFFGSIPKVEVPNLEKLKVYVLDMDFITTSLKFLEFKENQGSCVANLLLLNPGLEELQMSYKSINTIFNNQFWNGNAKSSIKKLTLERLKDLESVHPACIDNFLVFLTTQRHSMEELTIHWFSSISHNADPGLRTLQFAFSQFQKLRKLVIIDNHWRLVEYLYSAVRALQIVPNRSNTELRLRFEKTEYSVELFQKLATACPNLRKLAARWIDETLLKHCAACLPVLKTLYAFEMEIESLSNSIIRFKNLQHLTFNNFTVKNDPEICRLPRADLKKLVLEFLTESKVKRDAVREMIKNN